MTRLENQIDNYLKGTVIYDDEGNVLKENIIKRFAEFTESRDRQLATDIKSLIPRLTKIEVMQTITHKYLDKPTPN